MNALSRKGVERCRRFARVFRPRVEVLEGRRLPSTFTVTKTADSGPGSLRQAIEDANADPGPDTIAFDIAGGGVHSIHPETALPEVTDPVVIDGATQPGYAGMPLIELDGGEASYNGLTISAGDSTVRGLVINGFTDGMLLTGPGGDRIAGNYIGTDPSGTSAAGNATGIYLVNSDDTKIGGSSPVDRNVISGNTRDGIHTVDCHGLVVEGNYIGTDASGNTALGNGQKGLFVDGVGGTYEAEVGGTAPGAGNLISGNPTGIYLSSREARVEGNRIGTNAAGTAAVGNGFGIILSLNGAFQQIGGTEPGAGNLISGNNIGISSQEGSLYNVIQGNRIGTDVSGAQALGNGTGIDLGSAHNLVGGTAPGAGNLISGNTGDGLSVIGSSNIVQGNCIGTDVSGTQALGNGSRGIALYLEGHDNVIGGAEPGAANVIAANGREGIYTELRGTRIQGNLIGVDVTGTRALGNGGDGVHLRAGTGSAGGSDTVGGTEPGAGNVIAYSGHDGVAVFGVTQNAILGNRIFASGNLGIELLSHGNLDQPFPEITSAVLANTGTVIQGTLTSAPDTTYTLEFFANTDCNPSGYGEGEGVLGESTVTTDADGTADFTTTFGGVDAGDYITATATDPAGNTSAFSACVAVTGPAMPRAAGGGLAGSGQGSPGGSRTEVFSGSVPGDAVECLAHTPSPTIPAATKPVGCAWNTDGDTRLVDAVAGDWPAFLMNGLSMPRAGSQAVGGRGRPG